MDAPRPAARRSRRSIRRGSVAALALSAAVMLAPAGALAAPEAPLVLAVEETEEIESEEGGRRPIAETPRDVLALVVLASLLGAAAIGLANARRQLRGERPEADGRFRWR